jgi:predicted flap endonuclease-1-like 5' DNA nuclease
MGTRASGGTTNGTVKQLTDLPNIGKATAGDLMAIGIRSPSQLADRDPLAVFHELAAVMGRRHDPCVL